MSARAVIVASGARYRRLAVENLAAFEGSSVHYWVSPLEARLCIRSIRYRDKPRNWRPTGETSRPGVFAIGDVRAGSVKRVAAAVGEGVQVVAALHAGAKPAIPAGTRP